MDLRIQRIDELVQRIKKFNGLMGVIPIYLGTT
jgi:hypothetical protein